MARSRTVAPRFGIGEWYGYSFPMLSAERRRELADIALTHQNATAPPCPFLASDGSKPCVKKGGVCSLRLYQIEGEHNECAPVAGPEGDLRTVCPHRFKQDGEIYRAIGESVLGTPTPQTVSEVRFLQRITATEEAESESEDVGNIDDVLIRPDSEPLAWCALEIQAVYFSGASMPAFFRYIRDFPTDGLPFPEAIRRPDYRSSGPKRLMPQLQIKVPTLRRWGKKMAVVVDAAWFRANVIDVATVGDLSNCDIAWFIVTFDESTDPISIRIGEPAKQTLERAVEGLTGGRPVTLGEFEAKIREKLSRQ